MSTPSSSPVSDQSDDLAAIVGSVPGVDELYPVTPALAALAKNVLSALTRRSVAAEYVSVTDTADGVTASVTIGIRSEAAATDVVRRVHDSIDEYLTTDRGAAVAAIEVKVARIG